MTSAARASIAPTTNDWKHVDAETAAAVRAVLARPAAVVPQPGCSIAVVQRLNEALDRVPQGEQAAAAALREAQARVP